MPRTELTVQAIPAHGLALEDITWTAASAADDHYFENSGRELLLVQNEDASSHDITVVSVADSAGRTGDDTISTGAGDESIGGPYPPELWNQSGSDLGHVHIDIGAGEDTSVVLAVVQLPSTFKV